MNGSSDRRLAGNSGCILALGIGVVTVTSVTGAFSLLTGAELNLDEEWSIFLFQMLLVAAPFGFLALAGVTAKAPWIAGAILTATFWGLYLADGLARRGAGGANIGLGLLMLLSPLMIGAGAFAVHAVTRRNR